MFRTALHLHQLASLGPSCPFYSYKLLRASPMNLSSLSQDIKMPAKFQQSSHSFKSQTSLEQEYKTEWNMV